MSTERVASPEPDLAVCPALAPAIKSYTINRQTLFGPFPHARAHGIHWSRQALFGPVPHCQGSTESTGAGKHCFGPVPHCQGPRNPLEQDRKEGFPRESHEPWPLQRQPCPRPDHKARLMVARICMYVYIYIYVVLRLMICLMICTAFGSKPPIEHRETLLSKDMQIALGQDGVSSNFALIHRISLSPGGKGMGLVLQEKIENLHFPHESTLSWSKAKLDLALMLIRQRHQLQLQPSNFYFSGPTQDALWSKNHTSMQARESRLIPSVNDATVSEHP